MPLARLLSFVIKPLPVLLAALWVLRARPLPSSRYRRLMLVGLLFGALGDVLLILPHLFFFGLVAFLIGHVWYAVAFALEGARPRPASLAGPLLFAGAVIAGLWPGLGTLQIPVLCYVGAIGVMAGLAIDQWRRAGSPGAARAAAGACFFLASDAALAWAKFRGPFGPPWMVGVVVLGTYYVAQALLASSVGQGAPAAPAA